MSIRLDSFDGLYPIVAPHLLPDNAAQEAVNVTFDSGDLRPLGSGAAWGLAMRSGVTTIFWYRRTTMLSWVAQLVDVVASSVANDANHRLYWTTPGHPPQMATYTQIMSGSYPPGSSYRLGVPAPTTPLEFTATGTGHTEIVRDAAYVYTRVTSSGEESAPSPSSGSAPFTDGETVTVSGFDVSYPPGWGGLIDVVGYKLYRTNTGTAGTDWQQVGPQIAVGVETVSDTVKDADLGALLRTATWDVPPEVGSPKQYLQGLTGHPSGYMLGYIGNTVYASVPYLPHAWPYEYAFYEDVVGLAVFGQTTLVLTTGKPYVLTGTDPANLTPERLENGFACISKRSIVDMGEQIVYASPYGLVGVSTNGVELLTKTQLNKRTFADFIPATPTDLHAYYHDRKYIAFSGTGGFIYDTAANKLSRHNIAATCAFTDDATAQLFYVVGTELKSWDSGSALSITWKSKIVLTGGYTNFSLGRVQAEGYPVQIEIFADGVIKSTISALNNSPFPIPGGFISDKHEVRVTSSYIVRRIEFGNDATEFLS